MKLSLIVAMLALCSCAVGSTAEDIEEPVVVKPVVQIPAPKPPADPEPVSTGQAECVIDAYWVGNCYVVKIYCKNHPTRTEVACGPGRPLWPWEIEPYPPPYETPNEYK